jgi:hypothetical protein
VFTPQANGKINDGFGSLIIAGPTEIASQTFFAFKVKSKAEAESLKSYLETDYANFMLNLRKIDHHINKDTLEWILIPPLNKIWTNSTINTWANLTKREINVVKSGTNKNINKNTINNINTIKKSLKNKKGYKSGNLRKTRKTRKWT